MAQGAPTGYRAVRHRAPISERPAAVSRDHRVFSHCSNSEATTMSVTPQTVQARVCAGVDWAKDDHAIAIIDPDGQVLDRFAVTHDAAGLKSLVRRLLTAGVERSRHRTRRWSPRRGSDPSRAHRPGDPTRSAEELALALRIGGQ